MRKRDYRDGNGTFAATFLKCNRHEKSGGDLVFVDEACCMGLPPNCDGHEMIGIRDMQTGKKYAVHNRLLFQLNNEEIYWV
jgi:hypothetical protein